MTTPAILLSTTLMAQNFFDHTLLAKLVERGALTPEDAGTIAAETAVWCHELADESDRTAFATSLAAGFERIAEAFKT
ncbi:MAG: hypothetical protein E5Y03_25040 [Mesorhizobium sp.]|uniref:hypothetical protein n=1 Tax=Mesorhizobium sp. TaxID=1871066 RepID=UPI00121901E0|nr:hypothetical protein [Mesorhizobium sp.]TIN98297.1 MAG: hypothetical protein E5Y03_25040 [Mesorhizobium sp.]